MPPLPGFSTNPFHNYTDLKHASLTLLRALKPHQSPGGARITLPLSTGTHFDSTAAQLEGYARALWAVGTLLHASLVTQDEYDELLEPYVRGLANGTDPQHEEYWGPVVLRDQRMVEMEIISFALLVAPDRMFYAQDERVRGNIKAWLGSINGKDFPATNWLWFRVLTNLALVKVCGVSYESVGAGMRADLDRMEGFYLGEGWAADGVWGEGGRQADYYSGSFAIQFSQLVYSRLAWDVDPERCERYRGRAREFATSFWRYFDTNGKPIFQHLPALKSLSSSRRRHPLRPLPNLPLRARRLLVRRRIRRARPPSTPQRLGRRQRPLTSPLPLVEHQARYFQRRWHADDWIYISEHVHV